MTGIINKNHEKAFYDAMRTLSSGSPEEIFKAVFPLIDEFFDPLIEEEKMWRDSAAHMLSSVLRALTWLRDNDLIDLNSETLREFLILRNIIDLADPKKYPEMPECIRHSVRSYLNSLPLFRGEMGLKLSQTTLDHHGYIQMQFIKALMFPASVYSDPCV